MRNIVVVPYDPDWPHRYTAEAERLARVFGPLLVDIYHVGSTSVPGLAAKPIIDIMPVVADIGRVAACNGAMAELGYEAMGEFGIPGRRYFRKGGDAHRTHHVHVYGRGNPEIGKHLLFRDFLRAHPAQAQRYGELKIALAARHPHDIEAYMDGKDPLIKELMALAETWDRQRAPDE
jgi:GrpB-like predicted nucleotidyltransferase (UPF0157 family)